VIFTCRVLPAEVGGLVGIAEISGVEDEDVPLLYDLGGGRDTLFLGLEKKLSQFYAWSKI